MKFFGRCRKLNPSKLGHISLFLTMVFMCAVFCVGMVPLVTTNMYSVKVDRAKVPQAEATRPTSINRDLGMVQACPNNFADISTYAIDKSNLNYRSCWTYYYPLIFESPTTDRGYLLRNIRVSYTFFYAFGLLVAAFITLTIPTTGLAFTCLSSCVELTRVNIYYTKFVFTMAFFSALSALSVFVGAVIYNYAMLLEFYWYAPEDPINFLVNSIELNEASTYQILEGHYFLWMAVVLGTMGMTACFHAAYHFSVPPDDDDNSDRQSSQKIQFKYENTGVSNQGFVIKELYSS